MFTASPVVVQATWPWMFCSWPLITALAFDAPAVAVAAAAVVVPLVAIVVDGFLASPQPARLVTAIAAPATATRNPRFTTALLCMSSLVKVGRPFQAL